MPINPPTCLVLGGTGATGQHLVRILLENGYAVTVVARRPDRLSEALRIHARCTVVTGNVLDMSLDERASLTRGCTAIASCLGHSMSAKGIFGPPWRLVKNSLRAVCQAVESNTPPQPVRVILMNSTGCRNRSIKERTTLAQRVVVRLIRLLVPPHADNEAAAEYLQHTIGTQNAHIQWVTVRPDGLIDAEAVTEYATFASPTRSAIFNAGETSRVNVAHFMAQLMMQQVAFNDWAFQRPVLYNPDEQTA